MTQIFVQTLSIWIQNSEGNNTVFYPIVLTASGGMGGEMVEYLKSAYEREKSTGHWHMATEQPDIASTWNTMVASSN